MTCSNCQTENMESAKFCGKCGVPFDNTSGNIVYAGFFTRLFAQMIDLVFFSLLLFAVTLCVGVVIGIISGATGASTDNVAETLSSMSFYFVLILLPGYFIILTGKYGKTLGKKILGIKVVKKELPSATPGLLKALIRYIVGFFIDWITFGIGNLWQLWNPEKQALHDKVAGTIVIKT